MLVYKSLKIKAIPFLSVDAAKPTELFFAFSILVLAFSILVSDFRHLQFGF